MIFVLDKFLTDLNNLFFLKAAIAIIAPIHLFLQFWYHTQHIGKLGILEYFLVTPSQHRVHHAINPIYIDKNLGAIFCVWDRWFGTFQEELDDEPPVYGVLKPVSTWNPILINFTHLWGLILDFFRTKSLKEKLLLWFMPTGYRPKDVIDKYPINKINDVHNFNKYSPPSNYLTKSWAIENLFIEYKSIKLTSFLSFTPVWNSGISFGFLQDLGQIGRYGLTIFALSVSVWLILSSFKLPRYSSLGFILIASGAIGNAIDRIIYGKVVDFIDFYIEDLHWPAFNLADTVIFIGAGLFLFNQFFTSESSYYEK